MFPFDIKVKSKQSLHHAMSIAFSFGQKSANDDRLLNSHEVATACHIVGLRSCEYQEIEVSYIAGRSSVK